MLQQMNGDPVDDKDFDFEITDDNTLFACDNDLVSNGEIVYTPWARGQVSAGLLGNNKEVIMAYAEFSTSRLMLKNSPKLVIRRKADGGEVVNIPLNNYDVMLNLDKGLKWFEGSMGNNIKETGVPFDIDRKLTEAEMRMVFQIESTNQNAALNEIYMTWCYAPNPATKETAEGLLDKLRPLSDQECMDLIRKVQAEYRLPEKARTIGEMLAEARQRSGAQKLSGHDIMALERFDPATRHMIVFDVLTHDSPVGWKGEKMRLFLTDAGYSKALENQEKGHIKIRSHAKVLSGDLHYDHKDRER